MRAGFALPPIGPAAGPEGDVLSTLRRAAKVSARIMLNGTLLMEFTHSPE